MQGVEGTVEAAWSVLGEQDLCPAEFDCPLTLGGFSFFDLSDEPIGFTSVLSASLTGTWRKGNRQSLSETVKCCGQQ